MQVISFDKLTTLPGQEAGVDPALDFGYRPPHPYFEGTDACGKDATADSMIKQRSLHSPNSIKTIKSAGFFSPESDRHFSRWRERYQDADQSGLLLAATVFDLIRIDETPQDESPRIQVSHHAIRGAAYQEAFELPHSDLFTLATTILPRQYWPVALTATIPELQRRVKENPFSTKFDELVCEQPDKIERMLDVTRERCTILGGMAIDTTNLAPDEIAEYIGTEVETVMRPTHPETTDVRASAYEILGELRSRDRTCAPAVAAIKRALYDK